MNDLPAQVGYTAYETDPLFGALPGGYDAQQQYGSDQHQHQHQHQHQQYDTGPYPTGPYAEQQYSYAYAEATGQWDAQFTDPYASPPARHQAQTEPTPHPPLHPHPEAQGPGFGGHQYGYEPAHEHGYAYGTGIPAPNDAHGFPSAEPWLAPPQEAGQEPGPYGHYPQQTVIAEPTASGYQPTVQWTVPDEAAAPEAPAPYDAGWYAAQDTVVAAQPTIPVADPDGQLFSGPGEGPDPEAASDHATISGPDALRDAEAERDGDGPLSASEPEEQLVQAVPGPRPGRAGSRTAARAAGARSRRRAPAKRSALFTIAVPSACAMGVAGIAAASMGAVGGDNTQDDSATTAAADPASVKPVAANNKMDSQLAALSADARDFGDRASRTQERIDLKERQAAEKKKREEEAARKEAARPKYLLPVKRRGLSAYFGQAGINWMSVHTGIDFPVMTGTPVMAATDGTVRTQWNNSYGNMAIVTAPDGTETWYCHLSSTRVRSGSVKAGDVIAYSGNTGNTTGPHLHFEVRPGGGAAIDPLPWLRGHGLDPT